MNDAEPSKTASGV